MIPFGKGPIWAESPSPWKAKDCTVCEYVLSTPMTEQAVDKVVEAFDGTLELLKPYAADEYPHLLRD